MTIDGPETFDNPEDYARWESFLDKIKPVERPRNMETARENVKRLREMGVVRTPEEEKEYINKFLPGVAPIPVPTNRLKKPIRIIKGPPKELIENMGIIKETEQESHNNNELKDLFRPIIYYLIVFFIVLYVLRLLLQ